MLTGEEIIASIRSGRCKKITLPGFENTGYFADPDGHIYTLNNPREPKRLQPKSGKGLLWVTLYERDGVIRKLMVGDVIANTFMSDVEHDASDSTVTYRDGNPQNNAAKNLDWGTPQQQSRQLRASQLDVGSKRAPERVREEKIESEIPAPDRPSVDPLLEQLHHIQSQLEQQRTMTNRLRTALEPFARFHLEPIHATNIGKTPVVEANRGTDKHSTITVQDFREAKKTYETRAGEKL